MLSYDHSDNVTFNAQASQGFRLGGVNDPLNESLCTGDDVAIFGGFQNYGDETLWNYEAGVKVFKSGINFTAAAFYTDISDLQVTLDAGSCSSRIVFNVPEAHTMGLEAELSAELAFDACVINSPTNAEIVRVKNLVFDPIIQNVAGIAS